MLCAGTMRLNAVSTAAGEEAWCVRITDGAEPTAGPRTAGQLTLGSVVYVVCHIPESFRWADPA